MHLRSITWEKLYYCNFVFLLDLLENGRIKVTGHVLRNDRVYLMKTPKGNNTRILKGMRQANIYCTLMARKGVKQWFNSSE